MKKETKDALNAMTFMGFMLIVAFLHLFTEAIFLIVACFGTLGLFMQSFNYEDWSVLVGGALGMLTSIPIHLIMKQFRRQSILVGYQAWLTINQNNDMFELIKEQYFELKKEFSK